MLLVLVWMYSAYMLYNCEIRKLGIWISSHLECPDVLYVCLGGNLCQHRSVSLSVCQPTSPNLNFREGVMEYNMLSGVSVGNKTGRHFCLYVD